MVGHDRGSASVTERRSRLRYSFIKAWRAKIFARIEWKDTSKNPQEVKTTPSRNDLDLVKGLKRLGQALHAPKLPRSAGIPDSLTTSTAARRVAFARFASLRSISDSGRGLRPRTTSSARSRTCIAARTDTRVCKIQSSKGLFWTFAGNQRIKGQKILIEKF